MTRASLGWFVAGIVTVLACTLGAMQQQEAVGRYQLVEGRYQTVVVGRQGETTTDDAVALWRIDTVTGKVSKFRSAAVVGDNISVGFAPVDDLPE